MKKHLFILLLSLLPLMAAAEQITFQPGYAYCERYTQYDNYQNSGAYCMRVVLSPAYGEWLPQTQILLLVQDTMAIAVEETQLMAIVYIPDASTQLNVTAIQSFDLACTGYAQYGEYEYSEYVLAIQATLNNGNTLVCNYVNPIDFYTIAGEHYLPTGEYPYGQGLSLTERDPRLATKVLRNGEVLILRGENTYSILGLRK